MGRPSSTFVKMFDTVSPIPLMAPMLIMMISASMTAYSVVVGPSSETRNRFAVVQMLAISPHFPHNFAQDSMDRPGASLNDELDRSKMPPPSVLLRAVSARPCG